MSTVEWRRERAGLICRRVSESIARVAPAGIGRWDPAWDLVNDPSNAFLDALDGWILSGSLEDQRAVQHTATLVREAWEDAARRWEAAGRPTTAEASHAA